MVDYEDEKGCNAGHIGRRGTNFGRRVNWLVLLVKTEGNLADLSTVFENPSW